MTGKWEDPHDLSRASVEAMAGRSDQRAVNPMIVELSRCRWTTQHIDPRHVFPAPDLVLSTGPIVVGPMNDGCWFVHNGRHRAMRALLSGQTHIEAVLLPTEDRR